MAKKANNQDDQLEEDNILITKDKEQDITADDDILLAKARQMSESDDILGKKEPDLEDDVAVEKKVAQEKFKFPSDAGESPKGEDAFEPFEMEMPQTAVEAPEPKMEELEYLDRQRAQTVAEVRTVKLMSDLLKRQKTPRIIRGVEIDER